MTFPSPPAGSKRCTDIEMQVAAASEAPHGYTQVSRTLANPAPLGLSAFATTLFLISLLNLKPRGIQEPNIIISTMIFFGGLCQYISGIVDFMTGNTFGATVFSAFASFNVAYALIFIPGTGILAAYVDPDTGHPLPDLSQALAMFVWAWLIVCLIFTVASTRTSWALLLLFLFVDVMLLLIAIYHMTGMESLLTTSSVFGFVSAWTAYYAAAAGFWDSVGLAIHLPVGSLAAQ